MKNTLNIGTIFLSAFLSLAGCTLLKTNYRIHPTTYDLMDRIYDDAHILPIRVWLSVDAGAEINEPKLDNDNSIMHVAAETIQNQQSFQVLVDEGGRFDVPDSRALYPIHYAAASNTNEEIVEYILRHTPPHLFTTERQEALIHFAAESNPRDEVLHLLFDYTEEDPNAQSNVGESPLHLSMESQYLSIIKILLSKEADPNLQADDGKTPFHYALINRADYEIIQSLIQAGGKGDLPDAEGNTALHYAAQLEEDLDIIRTMLLASENHYIRNNNNQTVFDILALRFSEEIAAELRNWLQLRSTAFTDAESSFAFSVWLNLYFLFIIGSDPDIPILDLEILINQVDLTDLRFNGTPVLHHAIKTFDRLDVVKLLLSKGADPFERNYLGETALHYAAQYSDNEDLLSYLLDLGLSVETSDAVFGNTPLHYAAQYAENPNIYSLLVDAGASPFAENFSSEAASLLLRANPVYWEYDELWEIYRPTE